MELGRSQKDDRGRHSLQGTPPAQARNCLAIAVNRLLTVPWLECLASEGFLIAVVAISLEDSRWSSGRGRMGAGGAVGPHSGLGVAHTDVRSLPFPDASFDIVIDFGTCYHIARANQALDEIARVLVGGGIFATETKLSQILSHPVRTLGRRLDVLASGRFTPRRSAGLWVSYNRVV